MVYSDLHVPKHHAGVCANLCVYECVARMLHSPYVCDFGGLGVFLAIFCIFPDIRANLVEYRWFIQIFTYQSIMLVYALTCVCTSSSLACYTVRICALLAVWGVF